MVNKKKYKGYSGYTGIAGAIGIMGIMGAMGIVGIQKYNGHNAYNGLKKMILRSRGPSSRSSYRHRVAVKELKLSYYIGETLLFTIYAHYGNLI